MIPQQSLIAALPVAATTLAAILRSDRLPKWANYIIIAIFFVGAVFFGIVYGGGLTGDPGKDFVLVVGICAAIFAALETAMSGVSAVIPSPIAAIAESSAKKAAFQQELALWAAAQSKVPPRASATPQPPPGGSVIAPPTTTPADQPTRLDMPAIPPKQQPPTNQ